MQFRIWNFNCALIMGLASPAANAASFHVIYTFGPEPDVLYPEAGLIADESGRLYGLAAGGSGGRNGGIYRLTRPSTGAGPWTEEVLHGFNGSDGSGSGGSLLFGSSGELYGTTSAGGRNNGGTAFRLDPTATGWTAATLRNFGAPSQDGSQPDGEYPSAGLVFGPDGLLYGVTASLVGVTFGGTTFSLSPSGHDQDYRTLHRFDTPADGNTPDAPLLPVGDRFLGTTVFGPTGGTIFRLKQAGNGHWRETIIHQFGGAGDFGYPQGALIQAKGGVIYGCAEGGPLGQGGVFSLTKSGGGTYAYAVLYSFGAQPNDPSATSCGLTINPAGQIFGATGRGGTANQGTFFELDPPAAGASAWTEAVLHSFTGTHEDGIGPSGAPLRQGNVYYGVTVETSVAEPYGYGTVYQITP